MPITDLASQLRRDEGTRLHLYKDSVGKFTIGVGRNLDDCGISQDEADLMLANDIKIATLRLESAFPWTMALDEVRKAVLLNMTFNMGIRSVAEFKNTLALIKEGKYSDAAQEMLQSKWAQQVGSRASRLAVQLESGQFQ